jgi:hypothetical protein
MRGLSASLERERAAHRAQMLALIGRLLREGYDTAQPLPDRLSDIVRKIERSERTFHDAGPCAAVGKKDGDAP